mgnify:CR=1 FL=1
MREWHWPHAQDGKMPGLSVHSCKEASSRLCLVNGSTMPGWKCCQMRQSDWVFREENKKETDTMSRIALKCVRDSTEVHGWHPKKEE